MPAMCRCLCLGLNLGLGRAVMLPVMRRLGLFCRARVGLRTPWRCEDCACEDACALGSDGGAGGDEARAGRYCCGRTASDMVNPCHLPRSSTVRLLSHLRGGAIIRRAIDVVHWRGGAGSVHGVRSTRPKPGETSLPVSPPPPPPPHTAVTMAGATLALAFSALIAFAAAAAPRLPGDCVDAALQGQQLFPSQFRITSASPFRRGADAERVRKWAGCQRGVARWRRRPCPAADAPSGRASHAPPPLIPTP